MAHEELTLPLSISSPGDARRLKRELLALDDFLNQAQLRKPGTTLKALPKTSVGLTEFTTSNKLNLINDDDRKKAIDFAGMLSEKAPVVHISFASDPSAAFTAKITGWFRSNINPHVLVSVGLEPSIAAGCMVWTDNHQHDFSLKQSFDSQRASLIEMIKVPLKQAT